DSVPTPWLSRFSKIGRLVRARAIVVPPVMDALRGSISPDDEIVAIESYLRGLRRLGTNLDLARGHFEGAVRRNPWVAEPRLLLALTQLLSQDWKSAAEQAWLGLKVSRQWGTAWDKRRSWTHWQALAEWLGWLADQSARRPQWAQQWHSACWFDMSQEPF